MLKSQRKIMNRIIYIIVVLMTLGQTVHAQNEVQDMNAIKSNINYIYSTGTSLVSYDEASQNAKDLLNAEIEDWLKKNVESDIAGYIAKSQEQLGLIQTKRGSLYRVFAYVNKADILPYYKDQSVISGTFSSNNDTSTVELQKIEQSIKHEEDSPVQKSLYVPNMMEQGLLKIKTFSALNDFINHGREDGSIVQLGKYSTLPKDGLVYVFIHNREGQIPACMKIDNGYIINLSTCKEDQITNYKGCGAIWIRFK